MINYKRMYWFQLIYICFMFTFIIGITCNFVVVTQNKGKMPVYTCYYVDDDKYVAYENNSEVNYPISEVNYPILTDRFYIHNKIFSIGDLIMIFAVLGMFVTVFINTCTKFGAYKR